MVKLIWNIISTIQLIIVIWYMISVRKQAKMGEAKDSIDSSEKIYFWIASLAEFTKEKAEF